MQQYLDLLQQVLDEGVQQSNRTGIDTMFIPGAMMKFDLRKNGFPILSTKQVAFNSSKGEMLSFLRGYTNAADFRRMGCYFWDLNANGQGQPGHPNAWLSNPNRKGEDDLGDIYGAQWRRWPTWTEGTNGILELHHIDQVQQALSMIRHNPTNRRIIINAWNPSEFDKMSLPPCHVMYQFICDTVNNRLHMTMYQRSCDMFLGVPMNITGAALLLCIMAELSGMEPGTFTHFMADVHIYMNHMRQVHEQLERKPKDQFVELMFGRPFVKYPENEIMVNFDQIMPGDIWLEGYDPHPPIKAMMAV